MNDRRMTRTLLLEAHRCVAQAAEDAMAKIGSRRRRPQRKEGEIDAEALIAYPANSALSAEEEHAIRSMKLSTVQRSAIQKLIADGCATAFFNFFNLIDGTGDPEVEAPRGTWLGAWLVAPRDDRDRDFLHDGFLECHEEYESLMRRKRD